MTLFENYIYDIISQNEVINEDIRYEITSDLIARTQDAWEPQSPKLSSKYTIEEFYNLLKKYHNFKKNKVVMNNENVSDVNDFVNVIKKKTRNKNITKATDIRTVTTQQFFLVRFTPAMGKNSKTYEALKALEDYSKNNMFNPQDLIDLIQSEFPMALNTSNGPLTSKNLFGSQFINFTINCLQTRYFLNDEQFARFMEFIDKCFKNKNFVKNVQTLKTSFIRAKEEAGTINIAYSDKISIPF